MSISRRLQLTAIVAVLLVATIGVAISYSVQKVNHEITEIRFITDLFRGVAELRFVATEYLLSGTTDLDQVFKNKYGQVRALGRMPEMFNHDGEELIAVDIERGFLSMDEIFAAIKKNDPMDSADAAALEKHLIGQFLIKSQSVLDDAFRMQALNQQQIQYAQKMALLAIAFAVTIMLGILLGVAFLIYWKIIRPLLNLDSGMRVVAGGNYDYRLSVRGHDEIASVAGSFNEMTKQLKQSRGELDQKIKELESSKTEIMELLDDVRKFQEAVESVDSMIIFTDPEGIVLYANKATVKITGYSLEEIVGNRPSLWGNQMSPEFYKDLWNTIKFKKQPFFAEIKNRRKDGEFYIVDSHITPILDQSNNIKFFVSVERDITREKVIDSAKTEFVSVASHQLRTPLSAMKWITELLLESKGRSEKERERLMDLEQSTERLISLVNNLLNISRIESGKALGARGVVMLRTILENSIDSLRGAAESRRQTLALEYHGMIGEVFIVTLSIIEAIKIVVSNAINYAPEGTEIKVGVFPREEDYMVSVHNIGSYISAEDRPRMFEKFFRGSMAKKVKTEGSGLGLFIAKSSIEANGGKIWLESDRNTGTTFYLTVPRFEKNK